MMIFIPIIQVDRLNAPVNNDVMNPLWGGKTFYKENDGGVRLDNRALPLIQNLLGGVSDVTSPIPLLGGLVGDIVDGVSDVLSINAVDADVYNISSSAMDDRLLVKTARSKSYASAMDHILLKHLTRCSLQLSSWQSAISYRIIFCNLAS